MHQQTEANSISPTASQAREGEAPAEPKPIRETRLGGSLARAVHCQPARTELIGAALAMATVMALTFAAAQAGKLFTRPLWCDEVFTYLLSSDPGFGHSTQALRAGTDCNPPLLFILMRAWGWAFGLGNASMRLFAATSILAALTGAYALLRLTFSRLPAAVAVLALWAHPLVIHYATDARFYGPWLALVAWLCFALRKRAARPTPLNAAATALLSLMICTIHYFGIISLGLIVCAEWVTDRRASGDRFKHLLPMLAGPAGLILCLPFYLGQNQGLTISIQAGTWVPPFTSQIAHEFLSTLLAPREVLAILCLGLLISYLTKRTRDKSSEDNRPMSRTVVTPASLALLPVVLIAFSLLVQPAMVARYALPCVLVIGLAAGCMAAQMSRPVAAIACLLLVLSSVEGVRQHAAEMAQEESWITHTVQGIRAVPADEPVICYKRDQAYVLTHAAPDLAERVTVLDYDKPFDGEPAYQILGRDFARKLNRFYPTPRLLNVDHVSPGQRFFFIAELPGAGTQHLFPGYLARPVGPIVFQMDRITPGAAEARTN